MSKSTKPSADDYYPFNPLNKPKGIIFRQKFIPEKRNVDESDFWF